MIDKLFNFIKQSYHRPTAKLEHIFVLIFKIFLNKKTFLFSEKLWLLKFPPFSTVYFNFLGRFFYALINLASVIFFSRFADKSLSIEKNNFTENNTLRNKIGNNFSPWPEQALHIFENTKEVDDEFLNRMFIAYNQSNEDLKKTNFKDSPWWKELRKEFNTIFIEDKKVNKKI